MATRRYVVQLKATKTFTVEADSIYAPNSGCVILIKGQTAIASFPREKVEYVVEESLSATVTQAYEGCAVAPSPPANATPKSFLGIVRSWVHDVCMGVVGNAVFQSSLSIGSMVYAYYVAHPVTVVSAVAVTLYALVVSIMIGQMLRYAFGSLREALHSGGIIAFWNVLFFFSSVLAGAICMASISNPISDFYPFGLSLAFVGLVGMGSSFFIGGFRAAWAGQKFPNNETIRRYTEVRRWDMKSIIVGWCRRMWRRSLGGQYAH